MSRRLNRPLTSIVFPKSGPVFFKQVGLPLEMDQLEEAIIQRSVKCLGDEHEDLEYLGRAPEPGDALLRSVTSPEIYLQLGEVVDSRRIRSMLARKSYGESLWADNEIRSTFSGVKLWILDTLEVCTLPKISSKDGRNFLEEFLQNLQSLKDVVESLPENAPGEGKGKKTRITLSTQSITLDIQMIRYAPKNDKSPPKWIWAGSHRVDSDDSMTSFKNLLERKIRHYGRLTKPFWLLLYSLDCECGGYEQACLADFLSSNRHPFDRVLVFSPRTIGGEVKQIYPRPEQLPRVEEIERKKLLARFLPEDAIPKLDDPRWITVVQERNATDGLPTGWVSNRQDS